jgi:hypothetical protein
VAVILVGVWAALLVALWPWVRGRGQDWRLALWLTLFLGPAGPFVWWMVRRSARRASEVR